MDLASAYGLVPDEWQELVLDGWLGLSRGGKWSSPRCGLAVPRQNGKNGILEVRELYGMVLLGEKFLHTAHEVKTARKAFSRLLHFFDNPRKYPELNDLVQEIRRTNGQEAIVLANGGSVEFIARSKGSGRGFTVDVLVCDEAQELSDDTLAALLPTISAAPLANPQIILTGTPPAPSMNGEVFTRMRKAGHAGKDKRLCWHEWSCLPGADMNDRANWAQSNPALGKRLSYETTGDEQAAMDEVTFGRERGGIWDEDDAEADLGLDVAKWRDLTDKRSKAAEWVAFGLDTTPNRAYTSIAAVGAREDHAAHVEIVDHKPGTGWVVGRCVYLNDKYGPAPFVMDSSSPAASMIDELEAAGLDVVVLSAPQLGRACAWLVDAVADSMVWHGPDELLDAAVVAARRKDIGDGLFRFTRRATTTDISPLMAVTAAAHVLPSTLPLDDVSISFL